jgi:hypothetical protein
MNPRQTWLLVLVAALLFCFIYFFERHQKGVAPLAPSQVVNLQPQQITGVEITVGTNQVVAAAKKNGFWFLTRPPYPAEQTPIESFTGSLLDLRVADEIPPGEALAQGIKSFGLAPPQATVTLEGPGKRLTLLIGNKTVLTNNVYMQIAGSNDVLITQAGILDKIPSSSDLWRNRSLLPFETMNFDHVQIRSGTRLVEVERNPTNKFWRISKPIPARADQDRISGLLQVVRNARVDGFVTDSPTADLDRYGLQSPDLELSFLQGTNNVAQVQFGASPTNLANEVYARRSANTNIVLVDRRLADFLRQPYKTFHESHLLSGQLQEVDRIEARSIENFALQRDSTNRWILTEPQRVPAAPQSVALFMTNLANLEILDLVREVPSEDDLKALGFGTPIASYALYDTITNSLGLLTNVLMTRIDFGTNQVDTIFVRRSDESPIYLTRLSDMLALPKRVLDLRDRTVWRFESSNIVSLTITNKGQSGLLGRGQNGQWSGDAVLNAAIDETLHRLGELEAISWVARGAQRLKLFGITENSYAIKIDLAQDGKTESHYLAFGNASPARNVYASTILPGETEPVIFEVSPILYQQLIEQFQVPGK